VNTLDDLRTTLHAHAPAADAELAGRVTSVRARVRVVRRRRRVRTAVGAVAAVAVVLAGIALPRLGDSDRRPDFAGLPDTVTVGGFGYRFEESGGVEGDGHGRVEETMPIGFDRHEQPSAVVLAAKDLDGGSATLLDAGGEPIERLVDDGVTAAIPLPEAEAGKATELTLQVEGAGSRARVEVARYRRTDVMPKGVVDPTGHTVFRQQVGGRVLLSGAFVEPGRAEQTIRFKGALADVRVDDFCSVPGHPDDADRPWVHVSIDGGDFTRGSCGPPEEDASQDGSYSPDDHEVEDHTVRVWVAPTEGGAPTPVADAVVGVAVYASGPTREAYGSTIDSVVEFGGRAWQLDSFYDSDPGAHRIEASWHTLRHDLLVGYAVQGTRRVTTGGSIQGDGFVDRTADDVADQHSSSLVGVLLPGDEASFTVTWPQKYAGAAGAILVYRPLD